MVIKLISSEDMISSYSTTDLYLLLKVLSKVDSLLINWNGQEWLRAWIVLVQITTCRYPHIYHRNTSNDDTNNRFGTNILYDASFQKTK